MKKVFTIISILLMLSIVGCSVKIHDEEKADALEKTVSSEKLVVYMNAAPHVFRSFDEEGKNNDTIIYPSRHVIGAMLSAGDVDSPNANVFEKAIKEYASDNGIKIEVHYLEESYANGEYDILQQIVDTDGKLPDLLILSKQPLYDYYRLAEQGYLLDFSEYVKTAESTLDSDIYYQEVLTGGEVSGKQVAMPLLFNMNAMMTSTSFLDRVGALSLEYGSTYEEFLYVLEESCIELIGDKSIAAIHESSGNMPVGHYIPSILTAAAYPNYFDQVSGEIMVTEKAISNIFELMTYYNRQEFSPINGWEDRPYIENMNDVGSKSRKVPKSPEAIGSFGIFLSGGRAGGVGFHSSLLTDIAFLQTAYEEAEEELVVYGIPTIESNLDFSANITMAAYGMATTEHPDEVYDLVRYLMDYEFPAQYGFSLNKEVTNKQIENAQKNTISVYPENIWDGVNSIMSDQELKNLIFHTDPISVENVMVIQNMLDNISGAGLPYGVLEYNMYNSMLNMVGDGKMTSDEAGEWVITQWNQYLDQIDKWEPFYDANFTNSVLLYGDLPEE